MWQTLEKDEELYELESNEILKVKERISTNDTEWIDCDEKDVKIGDVIYVQYATYSQKYMYTHYPECGVVKDIKIENITDTNDRFNKTEISIFILNHKGNLVNLNKDYLSSYGNTRGYCLYVKRYEPTK